MSSLLPDLTSGEPKHGRRPENPHAAGGHISEVHGLRGLALLLVVLFHLFGAGRVSGGVDVFLLVSGFVVTRSLARRAVDGRLNVIENISRTAGRLVPSGLIVLAAIAAAAWWLMPSGRITEVGHEIVASALFYENWELIGSQLQYGAAGPSASPLQHFWSLSVQGQFLLVWPFVVLLLVGMARGSIRRGGQGTGPLIVFLVLTTAASLAYAWWLVGVNQPVAYFHSLSRFWEIGLGALFALMLPWIPVWDWLRAALGWLGLLLVVASGFLFNGAALYPGVEALVPVSGALLVLVGARTRAGWGPRGMLEWRPLRFLADISYELYLWHWPILVFLLLYTGQERITLVQAAAILAVSVVLAWLTNLAVAGPIRRVVGATRFPLMAFAGLTTAAALVAVPVTMYVTEQEKVQADELAALEAMTEGADPLAMEPQPDNPGPYALQSGFQAPAMWTTAMIPGTDIAKADKPRSLAQNCTQQSGDGEGYEVVNVCPVVEPEDPARTIVILGASHAYQWEPTLDLIAQSNDWRLLTIGKGGCRVAVYESMDTDCARWARDAITEVIRLQPDAVFVSGTRTAYDKSYERVLPGQVDAWKELDAAGVRTVAIRDSPRFPVDPVVCVEEYGPTAPECNKPRTQTFTTPNPLRVMMKKKLGSVPAAGIDMSNWLCTPTICPAVVGNIMVYRDKGHITATYSRELAPMFNNQLRQQARWLYVDVPPGAASGEPTSVPSPLGSAQPKPAGSAQPKPAGAAEPSPDASGHGGPVAPSSAAPDPLDLEDAVDVRVGS
ncbi:acyltransferase family protein [Myceligenerans cantabricum]